MTKGAMKNWNLEQALTSLQDALAEELLAVPDHEIEAWLREAGPEGDRAVDAVRRLANAAEANSDRLRFSNCVVRRSRAHPIRNQKRLAPLE
jgi:hypothetical protein